MIDINSMSRSELQNLKDAIEAALTQPGGMQIRPSEFIERAKRAQEKLVEEGKGIIHQVIHEFMEQNPKVISLRWTQYTPYFNDGEPCEFGINTPQVQLLDAPDNAGDRKDGFQEAWDIAYEAKNAKQTKPPICDALEELEGSFNGLESSMKAVFGDHVQVTVGRDCVANIEEYEHD